MDISSYFLNYYKNPEEEELYFKPRIRRERSLLEKNRARILLIFIPLNKKRPYNISIYII